MLIIMVKGEPKLLVGLVELLKRLLITDKLVPLAPAEILVIDIKALQFILMAPAAADGTAAADQDIIRVHLLQDIPVVVEVLDMFIPNLLL